VANAKLFYFWTLKLFVLIEKIKISKFFGKDHSTVQKEFKQAFKQKYAIISSFTVLLHLQALHHNESTN
jgi:hypothetical protein